MQPGIAETLDSSDDTCDYEPVGSSPTQFSLLISDMSWNQSNDPYACRENEGDPDIEDVSTSGGCLLVEEAGTNAIGGLINMYIFLTHIQADYCLQIVDNNLRDEHSANFGPPGMEARVIAAGNAITILLEH